MSEILSQLSHCVEFGKIDKASPYPPAMKGQDGADELAKMALDEGVTPDDILEKALIPAMAVVGNRFSRKEIYVPQMLMAAKAMSSAMKHLKPFFQSGETKRKGKFIIGTVSGDLHDIGKNLVAMMIEGGGWEVIDLGVDVSAEKFLKTIGDNLRKTVVAIREKHSGVRILVGGAPVTMDYCQKIGANFYSPDPQGAVNYLNQIVK
jgi:methanogenic corrinoid protein MtbC1